MTKASLQETGGEQGSEQRRVVLAEIHDQDLPVVHDTPQVLRIVVLVRNGRILFWIAATASVRYEMDHDANSCPQKDLTGRGSAERFGLVRELSENLSKTF